MHPSNEEDRRSNQTYSDKELYKLDNINEFIEKERRHDELDRLREVQEQKRTWQKTVAFCALLNLILIGLAIYGQYYK